MEDISNEKDIYEKIYDLFKKILNLEDDEEFDKVKIYSNKENKYTLIFEDVE